VPDGKRIAGLMPAESLEDQKAQNHLIFLQNFFDEVRRRTAARREVMALAGSCRNSAPSLRSIVAC
jgi:F0F1-type ATP synthase beta subunit